VLALAVLGNVEYQRALFAVRVQMKTYDVVRVEWPLLQFWGFALGAWAYPPTALPVGTLAALFCTGLATLCFFLGLGRLVRSRQALPLAACVGLLLAMGLYYAFVARDPWDGRMGHSWRVWKSSKWIFPLAAAVEAAGLGVLVRRARAPRLIPGLAFGLALTLSLPLHQQSAAIVRSNQLTLLGCEHFVTTWRGFCHDMDARGRRAVCLVRSPQERLYSDLFTRFYYPRPVRDLGEPVPPGAPPPAMPAGALVLAWGDVPDESVREQLLAGVRALDSSCPAVFRIINPNGMDHAAGGEQYTWLGALPARLEVWAPRAGKARLEFLAGAGPGLPGKLHRRLELTLPGGVKRFVEVEGATETSVALELPAGMTFVEVRCDGAPGGARHPLSDPRLMVAWMSRIRVVPEGTGDHRHEPAARAR